VADNVRQSTECWAIRDDRFMSVIARATSMSCSARPREAGTHFVIRTCVNRLAGEETHTIADEMDEVAVKGTALHRRQKPANGDPDERLRDQISQDSRLAADRKAEALSALTLTVIMPKSAWTRRTERKSSGADHRFCLLAPAPTPLESSNGML